MKTYPELVTTFASAYGISRAAAHDRVQATAEGKAAYALHLSARGIIGHKDALAATVAVKAAVPPKSEYMRLVALIREENESLTASQAHGMILSSAEGKAAYRMQLAAKGIIKRQSWTTV